MTTITVGDARLDRVVERAAVPVDARYQFPDLSAAEAARLVAAADPRTVDPTGALVLSFHSWLLRIGGTGGGGGTVVLVDPCVGNGKQRPSLPYLHDLDTPYLERLAALGVRPGDVDVVVSTHQHVDHVGWNTRWDGEAWVPTFPRATYLLSRREFEHFDAAYRRGEGPVNHGAHADSVLPVVAAGQVRLLEDDELGELDELGVDGGEVAAGVRLRTAPGHTPGSLLVEVDRGGRRAVLAGDTIHHVVQMERPELRNHVDVDPVAARRTRRRVLDFCADTGALLLPGHFPGRGAGRVRRAGGGRYEFGFTEPGEELR
jgi:glyoxylase-like metal-dependent hydrolase (beta-lactamase superfamily II)